MTLNDFSLLVRQARTYRRYDHSAPISRDMVIQLIDIARNVPSAMNAQPLRYRIVTDAAECDAVFECTGWAKGLRTGPVPTPQERPAAWILIASVPTQTDPGIDIGIAAQTIHLAVAAAGYSSCMLLSVDRAKIRQVLDLPDEFRIELLMSIGKPGEKVAAEELTASSQMPYWRTPDQVHHVPKRKLADVLIG